MISIASWHVSPITVPDPSSIRPGRAPSGRPLLSYWTRVVERGLDSFQMVVPAHPTDGQHCEPLGMGLRDLTREIDRGQGPVHGPRLSPSGDRRGARCRASLETWRWPSYSPSATARCVSGGQPAPFTRRGLRQPIGHWGAPPRFGQPLLSGRPASLSTRPTPRVPSPSPEDRFDIVVTAF